MRESVRLCVHETEQVVVSRQEGQVLTYDVRSVALQYSRYYTITTL